MPSPYMEHRGDRDGRGRRTERERGERDRDRERGGGWEDPRHMMDRDRGERGDIDDDWDRERGGGARFDEDDAMRGGRIGQPRGEEGRMRGRGYGDGLGYGGGQSGYGAGYGMPPSGQGMGYGGHGMGGQRMSGHGQFGQGMQSPGEHRGKGPQGYTKSDERIKEHVCDALMDDSHIDASGIDVQVKSGEVTLSGHVPERRMRRLAEDLVENLSGVKDVTCNLKVQSQEARGDEASASARRTRS